MARFLKKKKKKKNNNNTKQRMDGAQDAMTGSCALQDISSITTLIASRSCWDLYALFFGNYLRHVINSEGLKCRRAKNKINKDEPFCCIDSLTLINVRIFYFSTPHVVE
jgi:hypothetical protein